MAYALPGYYDLCKNIHVYSYWLWVTIKKDDLKELAHKKGVMVLDLIKNFQNNLYSINMIIF